MRLRIILLSCLLVTTGALGAFVPGSPLLGSAEEAPAGVSVSDDGHRVRITDEALPAATGWFLVTVGADADTMVNVVTRTWSNGTDQPNHGYAPLVLTPGDDVPRVHAWEDGAPAASVHARGEGATCCPRGTGPDEVLGGSSAGSSGGSHGVRLQAGEHVVVGFLASNWTSEDGFIATVNTTGATLHVEEVRRGTDVRIVDLVDRARSNGTGATVGDTPLAGEAGQAHVTHRVDAGLVALSSWVQGDARADVELTLPNGTSVSNGDGRDVALHATALTGPGEVAATLTNLDTTTYAEQAGSVGSEPPRGYAEAQLLVANLTLGDPALRVHHHDLEPTTVPRDEHAVVLNGSALPTPNGWLVAGFTAEEDTLVDVLVNVTLDDATPRPEALAYLVVPPDQPEGRISAHLDWAWRSDAAEVHAEGVHASCCPGLAEGAWRWDQDPEPEVRRETLPANGTLYVAFMAAGWGAGDTLEIVARPNGTPGSLTTLHADVRTGDRVAAVDLVEAAEANGTNAELLGAQAAGSEGSAHVTWPAYRTGFAALTYWVNGEDARGQVRLTLPNGTVVSNGDGRNVHGFATALAGSGNLEVNLTNVHEPSLAERATSEEPNSFVDARVLLADLPLPHQGLTVRQDDAS